MHTSSLTFSRHDNSFFSSEEVGSGNFYDPEDSQDLLKVSGVPALLVYRAGQLTATFLRLTDQLGQDFFANEVEAFLLGDQQSSNMGFRHFLFTT